MRSLFAPNLPAVTRTPICGQRGPVRVPFCTAGQGPAAAAAAPPTRASSSPTPRGTINSMHSAKVSSNNNISSRAGAAAAAASSSAAAAAAGPASTSFVSLTELRELCSKALSTIGYTKDEIAVLLEVGRCAMPRLRFGSNCTHAVPAAAAARRAKQQHRSCSPQDLACVCGAFRQNTCNQPQISPAGSL